MHKKTLQLCWPRITAHKKTSIYLKNSVGIRNANKSEKKKKLGKSIKKRPEEIEPEFMTITERKYRKSICLKIKDHSSEAMNETVADLL